MDGSITLGGHAIGDGGVLLDDIPTLVAGTLEGLDDTGDINVAVTQWGENTRLGRSHQRYFPAQHGVHHVQADIFEMDVADTVHAVFCELNRILAAKGHVSRVQAKVNVTGVENPGNIILCLHQGLNVGVENLFQAVLAADVIDDGKHFCHVGDFGR